MVALPAHLPQVPELPLVEPRGVRLCTIEQATDPGCREEGVMLGLERRQLLAADVGAALGHHHRRVPAQQRERATERVEALPFLLELLIGRG